MPSLHAQLSNIYRGKKVFLTGHTGFKGAWLAEWLLQLGAEVHGYALEPATIPALFHQLDLASRLHHQVGDVRNASLLRESILSFQPDFVFHLAAQPLVRYSYQEPLETYETNVMGTLHVLEALRELQKNSSHRIAAVMVTTDKCYENKEDETAYHEEHPLGGHDPYSSSKAMAEIAVAAYRRSYFFQGGSVHVATARAGNVIGGGDWADDRIVPDAIRALEKKEPILVRNPSSVRPWQHVLEPLCGYLMLGARLSQGHQVRLVSKLADTDEVQGVSGAQSRSVHEVLEDTSTGTTKQFAVAVEFRNKSVAGAFNFGPYPEENYCVADVVTEVLKSWPGSWQDRSDPTALHEADHLNLSIKKAVDFLGWSPVWNFEKTITKTVEWYRLHHENPKSTRALTQEQIVSYEADAEAAGITFKN